MDRWVRIVLAVVAVASGEAARRYIVHLHGYQRDAGGEWLFKPHLIDAYWGEAVRRFIPCYVFGVVGLISAAYGALPRLTLVSVLAGNLLAGLAVYQSTNVYVETQGGLFQGMPLTLGDRLTVLAWLASLALAYAVIGSALRRTTRNRLSASHGVQPR